MDYKQVFVVREYWTNSSDNGGNQTTIYNNYDGALKHFNTLKDKIYNDYNALIIRFKDGEYDYHINNNPKQICYTDEFIIQNFKKVNVYNYLLDKETNQFLIHIIETKGKYEEYDLIQEGFYKRTKGADLKIINICDDYIQNNQNTLISYFTPKYKTY